MLKKFAFILCLVLTCSTAYSGEKEHRALAEELIKITDGDTVMEKMGSSTFDVEFMKPPRPESGPRSGRPW